MFNAGERFAVGIGAMLVIGILVLALCVRVVGVGKVGVVTQLGQVNREVQSGVMLKLPWPFETLSKFDVKTQKDESEAAAASQDLQDVNATVVTNYHIEPGKVGTLYRTVGTDYKKRIIDPAIQESVKATTAKYPISDLITRRAEVKEAVLKSLRDRLAPRGILVEDISLTNLTFSKAFTQAIEQKQVAQQQAEQAKYLVDKAKNEAAAQIATAEGKATADVARAKGDAEAQRLRQQSLTPELLQQQAIEKWNGAMPTYYGSGSFLFNIPVSK